MTPTFSTISFSDIVSRAKVQLRIADTSEFDAMLEVFGREALGSLCALSQLTKEQCCLSVTGQTAKLPDNFVRYLALKVQIENETTNDPINNELFNGCQMMLYADVNFLNQCGCDANGWSNGGFQIRDGFIHFNMENTITDATLAYMGLNVDDKGRPVVYERYERGVASYMCYQYTLAFSENYSQYVIEKYDRAWQAQRSLMIGRDAAQSFQNDKRDIQRIWGAMLVSPLVNFNAGR